MGWKVLGLDYKYTTDELMDTLFRKNKKPLPT